MEAESEKHAASEITASGELIPAAQVLELLRRRDVRIANLERELTERAPTPAPVPDIEKSATQYVLQVFWKIAGNGFAEERSRRALISADMDIETFYIDLPAEAIGPLRIDLGDFPGEWFITGVYVRPVEAESGVMLPALATADAANHFAGIAPFHGSVIVSAPEAVTLRVLGLNTDPNVTLAVPERVDGREWVLVIKCRVQTTLQALMSGEGDARFRQRSPQFIEEAARLELQRQELLALKMQVDNRLSLGKIADAIKNWFGDPKKPGP